MVRSSEPILEVGDPGIDLANRVVPRAGREIHLTPTGYALLRELSIIGAATPEGGIAGRHALV